MKKLPCPMHGCKIHDSDGSLIKGDPLLVDHLEGNRKWRDRYRRRVAAGSAPTRIEYQAVCADGCTVTARVYPALAEAVKHAEAMDGNLADCGPHRVQQRTVSYGGWRDV